MRRVAGPELDVSRETFERLEMYERELIRWTSAKNLIASNDRQLVWQRHILDCVQLVRYLPTPAMGLDVGSGGGLPGLVLAILCRERGDHFALCEPNGKKASFLRFMVKKLVVDAEIYETRLETAKFPKENEIDAVMARAVAPLGALIVMTRTLLAAGARGIFPKGAAAHEEWATASRDWRIDGQVFNSLTGSDGHVVVIDAIERRG